MLIKFSLLLFSKRYFCRVNTQNFHSNQLVMGFISFQDISKAELTAKFLINNDMAACAKTLEGMKSYYKWENEIREDNETYLIIKTTESRVKDIETYLLKNHPYKVHEFIYTRVDSANLDYMKWLIEITRGKKLDF